MDVMKHIIDRQEGWELENRHIFRYIYIDYIYYGFCFFFVSVQCLNANTYFF